MRKFFVDVTDVGQNDILITDKDDIRHITKVLRMKEGDMIDISDGKEYEYITSIEQIGSDVISCRIHDKQNFAAEPCIQVTLFQGIPKQGKMETIIQKTVELGIKTIAPVFTVRTIVEDKGNFNKKIDRWQKVSDEAVKQCKRGRIPKVESAILFKEMIASLQSGEFDLLLFPYENEKKTTIKEALQGAMSPQNIAIVIGPEGGFSDEEANSLVNTGAISVSLGKTILRTETAGIVALSMIMYELEM